MQWETIFIPDFTWTNPSRVNFVPDTSVCDIKNRDGKNANKVISLCNKKKPDHREKKAGTTDGKFCVP